MVYTRQEFRSLDTFFMVDRKTVDRSLEIRKLTLKICPS